MKMFKSEDKLRGLWNDACILGTTFPNGKKREKTRKIIWKIVAKILPKLGKETDIQVHGAQKVPNTINPRDIHHGTI